MSLYIFIPFKTHSGSAEHNSSTWMAAGLFLFSFSLEYYELLLGVGYDST